ncbi:hypothetical protein Cgig2_022820 [Carnegiea gigantea]|uniref:Small ribosomal subunit protein mS41 SAM domain-containing protein n=1 Tax=Carnegiea gigantea TaxID=171969 RepID=A0A9Q1QML4_9CARY|nr:hypothetical protein Cgig2_022820 [Carnegiea gigantea]
MASIWRQIISRTVSHSHPASLPSFLPASSRFFSRSSPYVVPFSMSNSGINLWSDATVKVGIPEFLNGIGKGIEAHVEKLETEFGSDLQKLLVARTLKLKKLEIPCKHRKLILKYAHKYRLGLWRPRADLVKVAAHLSESTLELKVTQVMRFARNPLILLCFKLHEQRPHVDIYEFVDIKAENI